MRRPEDPADPVLLEAMGELAERGIAPDSPEAARVIRHAAAMSVHRVYPELGMGKAARALYQRERERRIQLGRMIVRR
jgi:hypothetical protein